MKIISVRAPVRVDFAGGWSDVPPYADEKGGTVVNAAINQYVEGKFITDAQDKITVEYRSDIPASSGLGTSAAMNVVWLKLINHDLDAAGVAEKSFWLEKLLGIAGGRQDQYAAAFGGINYMTFHLDKVEVHPIKMKKSFILQLEDNLVLCYTGKSRLSSNIITEVMGNFKNGNKKTIEALQQIREAAQKMVSALEKSNLGLFANLVNQNWEAQKILGKGVTNPLIDGIFKRAFKAGAIAGKATGAGGGGSLLFVGDKVRITRALEKDCQIIPFKFDFDGVQIRSESR